MTISLLKEDRKLFVGKNGEGNQMIKAIMKTNRNQWRKFRNWSMPKLVIRPKSSVIVR
jgi:hypothetical protein